jgi:hypothetical protein
LQEYDNAPNPFKGLYYIPGAFLRSFSANNYTSYTVNEYDMLTDTTYGIISSIHCRFPFTYDSDGWPEFGSY